MQTHDITLAALFKLIDTNSDQSLSISEFKTKMRALETPLDDSELNDLFHHLDKTGRGTIDYQMFVEEFPEINSKIISFIISYSYLYDQEDKKYHIRE
jgi:Ca2+-binding EF-hand superfamily protein